jgi:Family of unknown function (DUF6064)
MSEWWTYHLSDFLLFSPRTYFRLLASYNAAIFPAQVPALLLGLAAAFGVYRSSPRRSRAIALLLAVAWLWIAVAFHARRYASINWAAVYFAWAFAAEAALWLGIGALAGRLEIVRAADRSRRIGLGLILFAVVVEPLAAPLLGRGWAAAEIFGLFPDPTAVATLGVLLAARVRGRSALMLVPVLWCATTGLTLYAMKAPDFGIAPAAAALAMVTAVAQRRARGASRSTSASS